MRQAQEVAHVVQPLRPCALASMRPSALWSRLRRAGGRGGVGARALGLVGVGAHPQVGALAHPAPGRAGVGGRTPVVIVAGEVSAVGQHHQCFGLGHDPAPDGPPDRPADRPVVGVAVVAPGGQGFGLGRHLG